MLKLLAVIFGFLIFGFCLYQGERKIKVDGKKIDEEINRILGEE